MWGWSCIVPSIFPLGYCDTNFFVTGTFTVVWQVKVYSFEGKPKELLLEKLERSNRRKCYPLYCYPPMFPLDAEKFRGDSTCEGPIIPWIPTTHGKT